MPENTIKSKHILFKYHTIEELIQGTGYKPSFKAMAIISPNMTIDNLIKELMDINEITLACEVMIYALHPRARVWWGCSMIKSLHEELFGKAEAKEAAKPEGEAEEKGEAKEKAEAPKEMPEAVALPKSKEEAKEMLSQKVAEQKEALGLPQDEKEEKTDDSSASSNSNSGSSSSDSGSGSSEKQELTPEQKKELIEKLKALQEKQRAEQQAEYDKAFKEAEQKKQEALKKIEEVKANMSPEDKAIYNEYLAKIDQYFKDNIGMSKQEYIDFAQNMIKKAAKADKSGDPAEKQAVLQELASFSSKNNDKVAKMFEEINAIQKEFNINQGKSASGSQGNQEGKSEKDKNNKEEAAGIGENAEKTETAENGEKANEEKQEIDVAALIKEKEEAAKAEKIKAVEEKAANIENNLRKKAYEAAVAWVKEPTKPNTLNAEKYSKEAGNYPEGMLCLASFWSYGDFSITSASQKKAKEDGKPEQPDMVLRVDPSLPPKGIYSTLLMSALHEGGTRKPVERFALYYEMGEKIACGKDNWTSEKVELKEEQPVIVPEKQEKSPDEKSDEKPTYTKWKM